MPQAALFIYYLFYMFKSATMLIACMEDIAKKLKDDFFWFNIQSYLAIIG
jgi:hypothetical protein